VYKQILIDAKLKTGAWDKSLKRWKFTLDCSAIYDDDGGGGDADAYSFPKTILFFDQCVVRMQMMA
jgi:hypothetical protein